MRKDQWAVTVTIDGRNMVGFWDVLTGGETSTEELTYRPGGMGATLSLGGLTTVGQIVISRIYLLTRDHQTIKWLVSRVGKGRAVVTRQPLDVDGNAWGTRLTQSGVLMRVSLPEIDSNSTDAATVELEITPEGTMT